MCHYFDARPWDERTVEAEAADEGAREEAEQPTFLDEEPATDVDLLTDGGDEE
jgi:hypothetical protein